MQKGEKDFASLSICLPVEQTAAKELFSFNYLANQIPFSLFNITFSTHFASFYFNSFSFEDCFQEEKDPVSSPPQCRKAKTFELFKIKRKSIILCISQFSFPHFSTNTNWKFYIKISNSSYILQEEFSIGRSSFCKSSCIPENAHSYCVLFQAVSISNC